MIKKSGGILAGIIILGTILRLLFIDSRNIQYDDMFSFFLARQDLPDIIKGTAADTMPPLFYFLLHFWIQISQEIWFLRLLSVLISIGVIISLYLLVHTLFGERAALLAAFLAAISPLQIYHAQDIRMYALLTLSEILYFYFLACLYKGEKNKQKETLLWIGATISGVVAMYTHNLAIFGIIAPDVFLIITKDFNRLKKLVISQMVIVVLSLPWLIMVPGQLQKVQTAFWTPKPGIVEVIQSIIQLTATIPINPPWLLYAASMFSVQIVFLVYYLAIKKQMISYPTISVILISIIPPLLLFIGSYLLRPIFVTRVFIYAATVFLGLSGVVIFKNWENRIGLIILVLFIINSSISLPSLYLYNEFPRSPFQQAVKYLDENPQNNLRIIHDNKLSFFPMFYYLPDADQDFLPDDPGSTNDTFAIASQEAMDIFPKNNIEDAVDGKNRIAFVVFTKAIEEYNKKGVGQHPTLVWLYEHFRFQNWVTFKDLEIYYFER